ncbi:MAG: hypothetical protein R3A47_05365 [Polyangiales bacterium]
MHDLGGGFKVGRALPSPSRRMVGPYIFFDHMGPVKLAPGFSESSTSTASSYRHLDGFVSL